MEAYSRQPEDSGLMAPPSSHSIDDVVQHSSTGWNTQTGNRPRAGRPTLHAPVSGIEAAQQRTPTASEAAASPRSSLQEGSAKFCMEPPEHAADALRVVPTRCHMLLKQITASWCVEQLFKRARPCCQPLQYPIHHLRSPTLLTLHSHLL